MHSFRPYDLYAHLTDETCRQLREERVYTLEADHFRTGLLLAELEGIETATGRREQLRTEQAELERRITLHQAHLGMVPALKVPDAGGE